MMPHPLDLGQPAVLSDDGRYRYWLSRPGAPLDGTGLVVFVMLNPSTADASVNDATIARCVGYARRWGHARVGVVNIWPRRSRFPDDLALDRWPDDPDADAENARWVNRAVALADRTIVAWGMHAERVAGLRGRPPALDYIEDRARVVGVECLGMTGNGSPRHPLYLKADARPVPWTPTPRNNSV